MGVRCFARPNDKRFFQAEPIACRPVGTLQGQLSVTAGAVFSSQPPTQFNTYSMKTQPTQNLRMAASGLVASLVLWATPAAFAASQTWTNAPVSSAWNNTNNWNARAVPGAVNITANNVNNDVATFNSPLVGGIGGEGNPIITDDATLFNPNFPKPRQFGGITFDTANVGAYVIRAGNPVLNLTDTNFVASGYFIVSHNGSIQMTASVTNSQKILGPVLVRLPASTAGIYNLINNSTNAATLYVESLTNNSANTRGTDFRLGGSNTGTNTVGTLSAGTTTTGANGLTKLGSGTWILPGANDFRAGTVISIQDGLLIVKDSAAFSLANTATVTNTGILQIEGVTLNQTVLNLNKGGTIRMNGTASVNGVAVGNHTAAAVTVTTTSASDVFTVGTGLVLNSVVSGGAADSVLNTAGPGTIQLATPNTYVGNWSFNAATNQFINYPLANSRNVHLSAGAVLDTSVLGSYTLESLSFSANGNGVGATAATLVAGAGGTFDFGNKNITLSIAPTTFTGDLTHPALYVASGSISLNGNFFTINNTAGSPLGVGTYRLIQQASGTVTVSGGPFALVSGAGLVAGTIGDIVVSGGNVDLVVSAHVSANLSWQGGNPDNIWDSLNKANWNNGVGFAQFGNGDTVTFGPLGASFPSVNIAGTQLPNGVLVDTSAGDYTFAGAGLIAGPTALTKVSAGTLTVQTVNAYLGGTTVSNGTLRVGTENAIPSAGPGNVAAYGTSVIDLNGFNNVINGLVGSGTVDNQAGGVSVLTVGNNNANSSFTGTLKNTSSTGGTLALTKTGTGSLTLSSANTYSGLTTISGGTVTVANQTAFGVGDLVGNGGVVNLQTGLQLNSLAGTAGSIANNANASTNRITITGNTTTTYGGGIADGTGGGGVALTLLGGSLTMSGNNTYSGGTLVGSGASFNIPNSPAVVSGFIIASNNAYVGLTGGSGTPGTPSAVTTVDGAKVYFVSGAEGKIWQAQFNGGPTATNRFIGPVSAGQALSFSNFAGVVEFANTNDANLNFRFFNGGGISGGENTTFVFERVNVHTRDAQTVRLGAILGGNAAAGIGDQAAAVSWEIGAKNQSAAFHGYISGVNNSIVKVGTGTLTLDGRATYTNTVTLADPFEPTNIVNFMLSSNLITYSGATTVSNGVLKLVAPNNLTNSASISLAGGTLDATQMGYAMNETTLDYNGAVQTTNTVVVTNGLVEILPGQSLNGFGNLLGNVTIAPMATMNIGLSNGIGTLVVNGSVALNGTVYMELNRTNSGQNSDRLSATSFSGSGVTLNITNIGPTLIGGTTFQLFNQPISAFTTVNLPATDATGLIAYSWQNNLAVNGSITLLTGVNPAPAAIVSTPTATNTLVLSWPVDRTGWVLQNQTNALNVGLSANWFVVPGSATNNQVVVPVVRTNATVFYRLTLPLP